MSVVNLPSTRSALFVGAGVTRYVPVGSGAPSGNIATESSVQITYRTAGTFSNMYIRVTANATTSDSTMTFRKNTLPGNQTVTITLGATGEFTDTTNSDTIVAGDIVNYKLVNGGGGNFTYYISASLFAASSNTVTRFYSATGNALNQDIQDNFTVYCGNINYTTTETTAEQKIRTGGTLKNLYVLVSSNARTSSTTVKTRKNAADGNQTLSIGAGLTGIFEDTSNTDTVINGDLINHDVLTGTGLGENISIAIIADDFTTTNNSFELISGDVSGNTPTAGSTVYLPIGGTIVNNATESFEQLLSNQSSVTLSKLRIYASTNTHATNSILTSRKNAGAGSQSVTLTNGTTGWFEDTSNTDTIAATDEINSQLVVGTGGTLTYISQLVLVSPIIPTSYGGGHWLFGR